MKFEWDPEKEKKNIKKHGFDFDTATRVFADPFRVEYLDKKHSVDEIRYITIGELDGEMVVLTIVYTERDETIRLISARKADKQERKRYYDYSKRD